MAAITIFDIKTWPAMVELFLKDSPNRGRSVFDLSNKDKSYGPHKTITTQFTFERQQPLYNSKITPKLISWSQSVRY